MPLNELYIKKLESVSKFLLKNQHNEELSNIHKQSTYFLSNYFYVYRQGKGNFHTAEIIH